MSKSQAAMEYLTVYGWAILIIIIVLAVIYSLGLFNGSIFSTRAQAGACQVYRPYGPGTVQLINLQGVCTTALPKTVAYFNGKGGFVSLGNSIMLSPETGATGAMTLCMWYDVISLNGYLGPIIKGGNFFPSNGNTYEYTLDNGGSSPAFTVWTSTGTSIVTGSAGVSSKTGVWHFACFTYNYAKSQAFYYLNATQYSATMSGGPALAGTGNVVIGVGQTAGTSEGYSNIYAADLQIYNTSLSANSIKQLYINGIGAPPVNLQYLVGWWPLNGDVNDYSGNGNNGVANAISFVPGYTSGYTTP